MKILFVNNFRYRGGGEEFLMELLPGLIRKGASVGLVCRPDTPLASMFGEFPVEVIPVQKSGFGGLASFFKIAQIIRRGGYDIISIQRGHDIIQAWIAALLSGKHPRLVYTVHVADFLQSRFLLGRVDRVVTISRHIADRIRRFHPALKDRLSVILHGIDLGAFRKGSRPRGFIRNQFNLPPETPILSTSGSMWKNQIEFLDALVEIREKIPTVRYLLLTPLADMPQLKEFKDRADRLGVADSLLWHDAIPKKDMPAYYADIDIAVSTFRNEGFGLWIVEALAMGTPVVAFDEGGVRDALEGCPAGILIRNGAGEMAAEILRILQSKDTLKRMSEAGPQWADGRFNRERMIDDYYRFFDSLASN